MALVNIATKDGYPAFHITSENPRIKSDSSNNLTTNVAYANEFFEIDQAKGLGLNEGADGNGPLQTDENPVEAIPASSINPYFNVRMKTVSGKKYPVVDEDTVRLQEMYQSLTIEDLIENPRGACRYNYDDFLYVKDLEKVKLNRLVTLRRFAWPVFDDIFIKSSKGEPDIARAVTFSTQDKNKFSDITRMQFGMKWKSLSAASEKIEMQGTDQSGVSGIIGGVLKLVDPKYGQEKLLGEARLNYDPQHDENKVYGPVDSISETHIRDIGLLFEHSIELEFNYEMKSINGVNQKAAFMDMISNLIILCTNDAKFWGGSRYWVGPKPSKYMNMLRGYLHPKSWQEFTQKSYNGVKNWLGDLERGGKEGAKQMLLNIVNNAMNLALGSILNKLGRTGIPVMNSLLTGNPVGPWHLMIGNPYNPIICMGDLIMDNATLSLGDELGYDDFPTEIILKVTLKPAKARGRAEMESVFNAGKGRIYFKPKDLKRKSKTIKSTKQTPTGGFVYANVEGDNEYTDADHMRNAPELWSFLKTESRVGFENNQIGESESLSITQS